MQITIPPIPYRKRLQGALLTPAIIFVALIVLLASTMRIEGPEWVVLSLMMLMVPCYMAYLAVRRLRFQIVDVRSENHQVTVQYYDKDQLATISGPRDDFSASIKMHMGSNNGPRRLSYSLHLHHKTAQIEQFETNGWTHHLMYQVVDKL